MAHDGPQIVRPVPRRPFSHSLDVAPDDEPEAPPDASASRPLMLSPTDAAPMTRPQSLMNLTSSTLMGIYSQAASGSGREEMDTPWGTDAQTPIRRLSIDDATYELIRDRSHPPPPSSLLYRCAETAGPSSPAATAASLAQLFLLGVGYGVLVSRLHSDDLAETIIKPGTNWKYLAFWGLSGVVLGSLLPWFDKVWERAFGGELDGAQAAADKELGPGNTDWTLVMRAIGAFVGIVFAIRKLAWASTLQVSATLALVNPLLWWLIDRSKPGFVLSAAVGLTGSMLLLGVNPEMMPAPSRMSPHTAGAGSRNFSSSAPATRAAPADGVSPLVLGGLASQETVEAGVWMVSVLFCSCVCFGNIGRRLAWTRRAAGRGRWGDVR